MAKRRYEMTEEKIERWLKEGRGVGYGRDYMPWLTVRDVPSLGREHRAYSHTVGRTHHLLSDLEFAHFLVLDMAHDVVDIREQFPLPRDATRHIATGLKYRHPRQPRTTCDIVMTTDLLATRMVNGVQVLEAFAVKPSKEAEKKRTLQKLEIEGRYWESLGVRFGVLTEEHISANLLRTLKWLQPVRSLHAADQGTKNGVIRSSRTLLLALTRPTNLNLFLTDLCTRLDQTDDIEAGSHLFAARYLLSNRVLLADLNSAEIWRSRVKELSINEHLDVKESFLE